MNLQDIRNLVESTADASFAVDPEGNIFAWNQGAAELFGISAKETVGKPCGRFVDGTDECGPVCSENCSVFQAIQNRHPMSNFDLSVQTAGGRIWTNVSVLMVQPSTSLLPYSIHILRKIDLRKRLEILIRDFVVDQTGLPKEAAAAVIACRRSPTRETELTDRELDVLRRLAQGSTTTDIAKTLHISRTTVNNHVQHILRKLNAHTRLEAIRRAETAGLLKG